MIYAINKRTKEHKVVDSAYADYVGFDIDGLEESGDTVSLVEADPDGWIEWQGGECPLPGTARCDVKFRDKSMSAVGAGGLLWGHIIAYRPILDADTKPEPPAWDGESWPISIGTELLFNMPDEYGMTSTWMNAKVIGHDGDACVVAVDGDGYHGSSHRGDFRPIRSEEDRAIDAMREIFKSKIGTDESIYEALYNAIRDGKIPGVRLDD